MATAQVSSENAEQAFIDQVITKHSGQPGELLGILEAVQERHPHKYLPLETLRYVANKLDIPLSRVYSVATFYALFNLEPQGDNTICICRGTACHTRNSRALLESLRLELGLGMDDGGRGRRFRQAHADHPRPEVHGAHRGLLRAVRAGAGGGDQPSHLRTRERTDIAARGPLAGTGE